MGTRGGARRVWLAAVVGLALLAAACSGGGDGGGGSDPLAGGSLGAAPGEKDLQFTGAAKLRMGGTLTLPGSTNGAVPGVLIVPGPGPTNRDGRTEVSPPDPLYRDLSTALASAGVASFRYDRRGVGASKPDAGQQLSWDDMVGDAQAALAFLSQRREIDPSRLAVIGHDMGGVIALKLAAGEPRVKGVALVATPGRPLVDVVADDFRVGYGQESSDAVRAAVADLVATGSVPTRSSLRPEIQSLLPGGQDLLYKGVFSADPLADAGAVKVPVLVTLGERSTSVSGADADALAKALGGPSQVVVAAQANATLQTLKPPPRQAPFDAGDMSTHGNGPQIADAPRDQPSLGQLTSFLATTTGARPA
jgi:pimeloyl-ACP methyl ester carboxylesterase